MGIFLELARINFYFFIDGGKIDWHIVPSLFCFTFLIAIWLDFILGEDKGDNLLLIKYWSIGRKTFIKDYNSMLFRGTSFHLVQ